MQEQPTRCAAQTHVNRMLVRFDHCVQHFRSLHAFLIHQPAADVEQLGETVLDDLIKITAFLSRLEAVHLADCEQALKTGKDRVCIVGAQQLQGDVHKARPFLGEIVREDLGDDRDKLSAHVGWRRSENGDQSITQGRAFFLRNRLVYRVFFRGCPSAIDSVFEVDDR